MRMSRCDERMAHSLNLEKIQKIMDLIPEEDRYSKEPSKMNPKTLTKEDVYLIFLGACDEIENHPHKKDFHNMAKRNFFHEFGEYVGLLDEEGDSL